MKTPQDFTSKNLVELEELLKQKQEALIYMGNQDGSVIPGYVGGEKAFFLKVGDKVFLDAQLQKEDEECKAQVSQIKEECNEILNQFIANFNNDMSGSGWSIKRYFYKEGGYRRSLLELTVPDKQSHAMRLDKNGTTDLAAPGDLISIMAILQSYEADIFRAKLGASLNRKPTKTVRGHKI